MVSARLQISWHVPIVRKLSNVTKKLYRKKPESLRIHSGANLGDVVSDARMHTSSPAEEQLAIHRLFDHLQSNLQYIAALALALHGACSREDIAPRRTDNQEPDL